MFASTLPPWQAHVEVWLLLIGIIGLGVYSARVIQPKAVAAGLPPISRRQKAWFIAGVVVLWLASDWPLHDVAEERLFAAHMLQHSLLTVVAAPMFLLSIPEWLVRLMIAEGPVYRFVRVWGRSVPSLIVYNALLALTHWAWVVNTSLSVGAFHYAVHVVMVLSSLLVWMPVCGPLPELRLSPPWKVAHIFLMSVIPTFPAAFLTTAEGVLYAGYDRPIRMFGWSAVTDQQAAGIMMKVITGTYLWMIIGAVFFRWMLNSRSHGGGRNAFRGKLVQQGSAVEPARSTLVDESGAPADGDDLTFNQVADVFEHTTPPAEPDRTS